MIEEMMMEQNARIPGTNLVEQNCFLKDLRTPFSSRDVWARNPSQNQEIMMEQDAKRVGDKPGTLAGTRKGWWNRMPKEQKDKPRNLSRNQEITMEQDAERVGRQALEP